MRTFTDATGTSRPFPMDAPEFAAYLATHYRTMNPTLVTEPAFSATRGAREDATVPVHAAAATRRALLDRITHLEAVAERLADRHRVDSLRIDELKAELASADRIARANADQIESLATRLAEANRVKGYSAF